MKIELHLPRGFDAEVTFDEITRVVSIVPTSSRGVVPLIGVLMAIIWYSIAISETKTVKNWRHARQIRRAKVNIAKAAFRIMELQKEIAEAQNELNHFKSDTAHVEQRSLPHFSESTAHDVVPEAFANHWSIFASQAARE